MTREKPDGEVPSSAELFLSSVARVPSLADLGSPATSSAFADKSENERGSLCMWREFRGYRLLRPVRCGPNELRANAKAKPASDLAVDTSFGTPGGSNSLLPTILFCNLLFLRLPGYLIEVICDVTQRSARES